MCRLWHARRRSRSHPWTLGLLPGSSLIQGMEQSEGILSPQKCAWETTWLGSNLASKCSRIFHRNSKQRLGGKSWSRRSLLVHSTGTHFLWQACSGICHPRMLFGLKRERMDNSRLGNSEKLLKLLDQFYLIDASSQCSLTWSNDISLDVENVTVFILVEYNAYSRKVS